MLDKQMGAHEVVHRDIKKALNLRGVQVHGQNAVGTGDRNEVCYQFCGNRVTALGLAVLPGIAKIGDDRRNPPRRGAAHGVNHDQQFHQVVVNGVAGGLYDENILAADGLIYRNGALAVGKLGYGGVAGVDEQGRTDIFCQSGIRVAGEYCNFLGM